MSAANAAPATSAKTTEIAISFFIINPPETSGKEATDGYFHPSLKLHDILTNQYNTFLNFCQLFLDKILKHLN
jgi:hypothetical protein